MRSNYIVTNLKRRIDLLSKSNSGNFCYLLYKEIETPGATSTENNPEYFFDIQHQFQNSHWKPIKLNESFNEPCFYIVESHGSDISQQVLALESVAHPDSIISLWHFDNHIAYFENYKSAISCDINFITHNNGVPGYLTNPFSLIAKHIPACTLQFSHKSIDVGYKLSQKNERISKALFNYVDYPNSPRSSILSKLKESLEDVADFLIMPSSDRSRYWGKTQEERYQEWAQYKCTVILPLVEDLSTRVFDALATGLIPIVPKNIKDFSSVFNSELEDKLGIVRIDDLSPASVRLGIEKAISNFNLAGSIGILERINYVKKNALISHRIKDMTDFLDSVTSNDVNLIYGSGPNGIGIYTNVTTKDTA